MPYVCQDPDPVVYVHIPKTGGTQSRETLRPHGGRKEGAGHDSIRVVPYALRASSLCVASIRDPWSWYASLYEHAMNLGDEGRRLLKQWGNGSDDWAAVLYGMTHPLDLPSAPKVPGVVFRHVGSYPRSTAPHGLFTWVLRYFCQERDGTWAIDAVIDTAQLSAGWSSILNEPPTDARANARRPLALPADYAEAYTPEMIEWVRRADAPMVGLFGFDPFAPMAQPVTHLCTLLPDGDA